MKIFKLLIIIFFCTSEATNTISQSNEFLFDLDYAVFQSEDKPLLEFYYSFYLSSLTMRSQDNQYEAAGLIELKLYDSLKGETIVDGQYKVPMKIETTNIGEKSKKITGQINLSLNYGIYYLVVNAFDFYDKSKYTQRTEVIYLNKSKNNVPVISSIQLCEVVEKSASDNSPFYKNGLEVFPNPSRLFSARGRKLYYYFEIYGMNKITSGIYTLTFNIYSSDKLIYTFKKEYNVKSESKAEYGAIEITDNPSGKYKLEILMSEGVNILTSSEAYFWVFNDQKVNSESTGQHEFTSSMYFNMNEKDVDDEILKIEYLLSDNIREKIKKLNRLDEKRYFLFEFWKLSDPSPGTAVNEFRNEYFERINYANKNFGTENIPGWKTDRGRIYCLYGRPDEINRYEFESKTRPYEIWQYNIIQNGIIFVFGDLGVGGSNYQLIHSTARGEIYDENWIRRVRE